MGETKNIIEALSKLKIVGYFLALWGVTFFFRGLADLTYYAYNFSTTGESIAESAFYIISDAAYLAVAIVLWIIAMKIISAKTTNVTFTPPPP